MADARTAHDATRAALRETIPRLVRLVEGVADLDAKSGVPPWTVGDVGAHLFAVYVAFGSAVTGELEGVESVLPPDDGPFHERIAAVNREAVGMFGSDVRGRLPELLAERGEAFLETTEGLDPDTLVGTPWYGQRMEMTLAAATGIVLSESLLHGLDIARGARLPWTVGADEARLVLGQVMPTMMPLALDPVRARGVSVAYDLAISGGGPRLAVVIDGGRATVTQDEQLRSYDCRITAAPTAFLLVAFGRMPLWQGIARGQIRAGGRRPWLAPRLRRYIPSP